MDLRNFLELFNTAFDLNGCFNLAMEDNGYVCYTCSIICSLVVVVLKFNLTILKCISCAHKRNYGLLISMEFCINIKL